MFTSGIVSTQEGRQIALFFSGRQHAGENLADVLAERAPGVGRRRSRCATLSRAICRASWRRSWPIAWPMAGGEFVEVADRFPEECRHVLESLAVVYRNDAHRARAELSPAARRHFHQAESGPVMEELHAWLGRQLDERLVEPNSALGRGDFVHAQALGED